MKQTKTKKKSPARPAAKISKPTENQATTDKFKKVGDDLVAAIKNVRGRYQKLDKETKNKIITGVAGTLALFAGLSAVKKIAKSKKKK